MSFKMEFGFPREAEKAKKEKWPVLLPVGTMEYHGPHCAYGCDSLVAQGIVQKIAEKIDSVIMPTIYYGVASYAVAGPEKNTIQVHCDPFEEYIYNILKSLIYGGWRNIFMIIAHQTEDYNPMQLACMKAARKLIFEYLEDARGYGWWGSNRNKEFYEEFQGENGDNPWNWIHTLRAADNDIMPEPGDHAGRSECSMLSALYPEALKLERLSESDEWFIQTAKDTSLELGKKFVDISVDSLVAFIKKNR